MDLMRFSSPFLQLAAGILGVYLLYAGTLFVLQRRMVFPGQFERVSSKPPTELPDIEQLWIETDETRSEVWILPPRSESVEPTPAVIVAHGNAELIDDLPGHLARFREMGITVVLPEYPGYGRSEGTPTEASIAQIFQATYDRLADRNTIDASRIFAYGRSVGGGVACRLAADRYVAALILQSTFTRISAFAGDFYLPGFLVKDEFDNISVLRSYNNPVLIVHGRSDQLIPFTHARELADNSPTAELVAYDCGHNDCPPRWETFWEDVSAFLQNHRLVD
jgi:pimeloyl-ACP methyl ester carboxylesterase